MDEEEIAEPIHFLYFLNEDLFCCVMLLLLAVDYILKL